MIYSKLDWYSAVFEGYDPHTVLDWLQMYDLFVDMQKVHQLESSTGLGSFICISVNGISLQFQCVEFDQLMDELDGDTISFYDHGIKWMKLDISGSGLDFLRDSGVQIDDLVSDPLSRLHSDSDHGRDFHITRADFAFDFVNLYDNFIQDFSSYLHRGMYMKWFTNDRMPNGRNSIKFSIKEGSSESTIYLGSTGSDKMVRCYDKLKQMAPCGVWKQPIPKHFAENETLPLKSWFRIELQARREFADLCLMNPWGLVDQIKDREIVNQLHNVTELRKFRWLPILSFVGDNFAPRDKNNFMISGWDKLIPWSDISGLQKIGILRQVGTGISDYERGKKWLEEQVLTTLIATYIVMGESQFLEWIHDKFIELWEDPGLIASSKRKSTLRKILSGRKGDFCDIPADIKAYLDGYKFQVKEVPLSDCQN